MKKTKKWEFILIIAISILVILPFINQAFYIDDFIYLSAAIQYNESGFESFHGVSDQEGFVVPNYYLTHPLLWPWLLSVFINLFNTTSEISLHFLSIINLIIAGLASLIISKRYSPKPLISAVTFLILPSVMLLSHVVMTDLPTMSFFLLGLALHIEGIENKSKLYLILAGIAASISCGISYQALFIIVLFVFYNILKKEKDIISYSPAIIPTIFFIIWFVFTWIELGFPHPLISFQWGDTIVRNLLIGFFPKFIANINAIGATTIFPAFILGIYILSKRFRIFVLISISFSIFFIFLFIPNYTLPQKVLFIIYFSSGSFVILRFILLLKDSIKTKSKKEIFISVWFLSFFIAIVFLMPIGVARYLLPCFLPVVIIIVNDTINLFDISKFKIAISIGILSTAFWGILCSVSDYTLADIYRNFSKEIAHKYKNKNVWFCSDGFQWYMKKEGFKPLLYGETIPSKGDIIVMSTELWAYYISEIMERTELIDKVVYNSNFPIRTMNQASHAGFHDHLQGLLTFSITRQPFEELYVYKVVR